MESNFKRVLIIAAHPDDETLGCGGTIKKLIENGSDVSVLVLGEGSTCRYEYEKIGSNEAINSIKKRAVNLKRSLKTLGVNNYEIQDLLCGRFDTYPILEITKRIEQQIAIFKPDTVLTHFYDDTNIDHKISFQASLIACRPTKQNSSINNVLCYEVLSSTEWRYVETFKPNFFIKLNKSHLNTKNKAFSHFLKSEGGIFPFPRSEEGINTLAKMRGMQCRSPYAEAFHVVRIFT